MLICVFCTISSEMQGDTDPLPPSSVFMRTLQVDFFKFDGFPLCIYMKASFIGAVGKISPHASVSI